MVHSRLKSYHQLCNLLWLKIFRGQKKEAKLKVGGKKAKKKSRRKLEKVKGMKFFLSSFFFHVPGQIRECDKKLLPCACASLITASAKLAALLANSQFNFRPELDQRKKGHLCNRSAF